MAKDYYVKLVPWADGPYKFCAVTQLGNGMTTLQMREMDGDKGWKRLEVQLIPNEARLLSLALNTAANLKDAQEEQHNGN